jgi:hypothetical protein
LIGLLYGLAAFGATASPPAEPLPASAPASANDLAASSEAQASAGAGAAVPLRLTHETPIRITIDETMLSDQVAPGYRFPIVLAEPLLIEGRTALPAGIWGEGEVIDAKRSSGGGASGGIVANARYLMCGTTRIPLGKMHLSASGRSSYRTAVATTAAVGVFGLLVRGHNAQIQRGTLADAKIIADVDVPASC